MAAQAMLFVVGNFSRDAIFDPQKRTTIGRNLKKPEVLGIQDAKSKAYGRQRI